MILSPTLVTVRAIELTPAYTVERLADQTIIPQDRTAVPVEFDDFRQQLEKLSETLQPTEPGGVARSVPSLTPPPIICAVKAQTSGRQ